MVHICFQVVVMQPLRYPGATLALHVLHLFSLTSSDAHELHRGYEAAHTTELRHRIAAAPTVGGLERHGRTHRKDLEHVRLALKMQQRELEWERVVNLTTELQDMKSEYTGLIGVGTASDGNAVFDARVVFDTGSTNLWVASVLCHTSPCDTRPYPNYYDPKRSVTHENYDGREGDIDIMFGTGELKGPLHVDTYRVGPMVVKQQPFALIREMAGDVFSSFEFEGILGLAFKSLSFAGIEPFFERVIQQKVLENNEFAFYLNTNTEQPSALLWGGVDKDLHQGPITLFPVAQLHYWALELVEFRLGDIVFGGTRHGGTTVNKLIIDSGTTYFTAPSSIYNRVTEHIPEAPCSEVESYPPLTYVLRGVHGDTFELVVTQETYMIGSATDDNGCRPAFMALDVSDKYGPAVILGEVFMRHFFTVFMRGDGSPDQARIGIAAARIGAIPKVASRQSELLEDSLEILSEDVDIDGNVLVEAPALQTQKDEKRLQEEKRRRSLVRKEAPLHHASLVQTPAGAQRYHPVVKKKADTFLEKKLMEPAMQVTHVQIEKSI